MKIYVGQTRSPVLIDELAALGFGETTVRGEFPPRRFPYFFDNGAYGDDKEGKPFQLDKWNNALFRLQVSKLPRPDFIICPDIVRGGTASLLFSRDHVFTLRHLAPVYLAVQDGMSDSQITSAMSLYGGLFVGGSTQWKERNGERMVQLAHSLGKPAHIGRVGTPRKVFWAKRIGADSIDSSFPLWTKNNLKLFVNAVQNDNPQPELFK